MVLPAAITDFRGLAGLSGAGVVAVSGGADSVALLRGLLATPGVGPLTVAHFHHQLRPAADADAAFIRALAATHGLDFALGSADVRAAGGNLEATARKLRYGWLCDVARTRAAWLATGHTADDNAETVLHHLVRGTGLAGLRGIAPEAARNGVPIVRPLLAVTRAEVEAYLAELRQGFVTDATNADPAFTRNRVRVELLPLLRTFNPRAVAALGRLARQADEVAATFDAVAAEVLARHELARAGGVVVLSVPLNAAPPVLHALLAALWKREGWPARDMDEGACCAAARRRPSSPAGVAPAGAGRW
jgi:tRNA(Ile)-lysidine synthase